MPGKRASLWETTPELGPRPQDPNLEIDLSLNAFVPGLGEY